jgi:hypothetical protein
LLGWQIAEPPVKPSGTASCLLNFCLDLGSFLYRQQMLNSCLFKRTLWSQYDKALQHKQALSCAQKQSWLTFTSMAANSNKVITSAVFLEGRADFKNSSERV